MSLVRRYKISKLLNQPLTGIDKEVIDFIKSKISYLIPFVMEKYHDSVFYMNNECKWILEQDNAVNVLWVTHDFWLVLYKKYLMKNPDIQEIIKIILFESFNQKVSTSLFYSDIKYNDVEEAFKKHIDEFS